MPSTDHSIITNDDSIRLSRSPAAAAAAAAAMNSETRLAGNGASSEESRPSDGDFPLRTRSPEASRSDLTHSSRRGDLQFPNANSAGDPAFRDTIAGPGDGPATEAAGPATSVCSGIRGCLRGVWTTRDTRDFEDDKEGLVKATLREFVVYIFFLVVLCVVAFAMTSATQFYFTKVLSDLFTQTPISGKTTFRTASTVGDVWGFLEGPLVKGLHWETWYNNEVVAEEERGYILYESRLLGVPRLRSVRVRNTSCSIHPDFVDEIKECYSGYSSGAEESTPFGPGAIVDANASWPFVSYRSAWTYSSAASLGASLFSAGRLATYSGGGYVQPLTSRKADTLAILADLKHRLWLDRASRALFVDFTVYNANVNLFCQVRLTAEFPATGGAVTSSDFRAVKLLRLDSPLEDFVAACQIMFVVFLAYYVVEEIVEIVHLRLAYFRRFLNMVDLAVVGLGVAAVALRVYTVLSVNSLLEHLLAAPDSFADFDFLASYASALDSVVAVLVFVAWIKTFKYVSFNRTLNQLSLTLARSAKDLAGFSLIFFIIFLAFCQLAYLSFGAQLKDFSTFFDAFFTQLRIILGDFNYGRLEASDRILGPIYFFLFIFFVYFVLMNMFLAIIVDTYADVKGEMSGGGALPDLAVAELVQRGYNKVLEKLVRRRDKLSDIQQAVDGGDSEARVEFGELRKELRAKGYSESDIESVLQKYDVEMDRALSREEKRLIVADLEGQKAEIDAEMKETKMLQRRRANQAAAAAAAAAVGRKSAERSRQRPRLSFDDDSEDSDDEDDSNDKSRGGSSNGVTYEEFQVLTRRVDRMEHSIGSIVSKIDAVLVKLEGIEKVKARRRETMGKLLHEGAGVVGNGVVGSGGLPDPVKFGSSGSLAEEALRREEMEKFVREEIERWDSEESTGGDVVPAHGDVGRPSSQAPSPLSGSNATRPESSVSSASGRI